MDRVRGFRGLAHNADNELCFGDVDTDKTCLHKSTSNKENDLVGVRGSTNVRWLAFRSAVTQPHGCVLLSSLSTL